MKIGGYVNLSLVHSFDPMLIPDRFIVGSIPAEGTTVPGAVEGTSVSAQQTRGNWEYREQTKPGEIRAFVEGDFQGDGEEFRRQLHVEGQTDHRARSGGTPGVAGSRPEFPRRA